MSPHHSLDLGVEVTVREADHQTLGSSKGYKLIVVELRSRSRSGEGQVKVR